jgi:hypothetical protein
MQEKPISAFSTLKLLVRLAGDGYSIALKQKSEGKLPFTADILCLRVNHGLYALILALNTASLNSLSPRYTLSSSSTTFDFVPSLINTWRPDPPWNAW